MKTPEVAASGSENIYLKKQYKCYLRVDGFDVDFWSRSQGSLKRVLRMFNGLLFADRVLWCETL